MAKRRGERGVRGSLAAADTFAARVSAQRKCAINDALNSLLLADTLDTNAVAALATRAAFVDATFFLREKFRSETEFWPNPLAVLLDRWNWRIRIYRVACEFRAIGANDCRTVALTLADLADIAKSGGKRAARARLALASLGEIKWAHASRKERAAFVLGVLAAALLERGP